MGMLAQKTGQQRGGCSPSPNDRDELHTRTAAAGGKSASRKQTASRSPSRPAATAPAARAAPRQLVAWQVAAAVLVAIGLAFTPLGGQPDWQPADMGFAALHQAAHDGQTATAVSLACEGGAAVSNALSEGGQGDRRRMTPLLLAIANGHSATAAALIACGSDVARSRAACQCGIDVDAAGMFPTEGLTPLMLAAKLGQIDVVAALLGASADPSKLTAGGWLALHYSASSGQADITGLLLAKMKANGVCHTEAGPCINHPAADTEDATPMILAVRQGSEAVAGSSCALSNGAIYQLTNVFFHEAFRAAGRRNAASERRQLLRSLCQPPECAACSGHQCFAAGADGGSHQILQVSHCLSLPATAFHCFSPRFCCPQPVDAHDCPRWPRPGPARPARRSSPRLLCHRRDCQRRGNTAPSHRRAAAGSRGARGDEMDGGAAGPGGTLYAVPA